MHFCQEIYKMVSKIFWCSVRKTFENFYKKKLNFFSLYSWKIFLVKMSFKIFTFFWLANIHSECVSKNRYILKIGKNIRKMHKMLMQKMPMKSFFGNTGFLDKRVFKIFIKDFSSFLKNQRYLSGVHQITHKNTLFS